MVYETSYLASGSNNCAFWDQSLWSIESTSVVFRTNICGLLNQLPSPWKNNILWFLEPVGLWFLEPNLLCPGNDPVLFLLDATYTAILEAYAQQLQESSWWNKGSSICRSSNILWNSNRFNIIKGSWNSSRSGRCSSLRMGSRRALYSWSSRLDLCSITQLCSAVALSELMIYGVMNIILMMKD